MATAHLFAVRRLITLNVRESPDFKESSELEPKCSLRSTGIGFIYTYRVGLNPQSCHYPRAVLPAAEFRVAVPRRSLSRKAVQPSTECRMAVPALSQ